MDAAARVVPVATELHGIVPASAIRRGKKTPFRVFAQTPDIWCGEAPMVAAGILLEKTVPPMLQTRSWYSWVVDLYQGDNRVKRSGVCKSA